VPTAVNINCFWHYNAGGGAFCPYGEGKGKKRLLFFPLCADFATKFVSSDNFAVPALWSVADTARAGPIS